MVLRKGQKERKGKGGDGRNEQKGAKARGQWGKFKIYNRARKQSIMKKGCRDIHKAVICRFVQNYFTLLVHLLDLSIYQQK